MAIPSAKIKIGGKNHLLSFGLDFLERLNNKYKIENNGFAVSAGLQVAVAELYLKNPVIIKDMIVFATATNASRPTESEIEEYIFEQSEDEEKYNKLYEDFFGYLKLLPGATHILKAAQEQGEKIEKTAQK